MAKCLRDSGNEILSAIGSTYMKWAAENPMVQSKTKEEEDIPIQQPKQTTIILKPS